MMPTVGNTGLGIERQLAEERAAALGRIGRRLERLLQALDRLADRYRRRSGPARASVLISYRRTLEQARRYRWYLEVQREAVGLHRHEVLDRVFPLPPQTPPGVEDGG